jgi:hypothetical protein
MSHPFNPLSVARLAALLVTLTAAAAAHAQTPASPETAPPVPAKSPTSARIERITHEDSLSRVDELRVGGQTRSIEVTPKNGAPAYEIAPPPGGANLSESNAANKGSTGKSRWRILSF